MYVTAQMHFICSDAGSSHAHIKFSCPKERSGKALEHGIWKSEVQFPMETEVFFFVPWLLQNKKHLSLFVYRGQKLSFSNSEEHRGCHQVWSNTFESKGMTFLLIELNEPIN